MKVSFIVPNYNGEKYIDNCLSSIYTQSFKKIEGLRYVEVILVDNASTDDSVIIAQRKFKGLKVLLNRSNLGTAAALNKGIEAAQGEYIAVVHIDTILDKDWLKNSLEVFEENSKTFAVAGLIIKNDNSKTIDSKGFAFTKTGYAYKIGSGRTLEKSGKQQLVMAPHNAAALYKKSCFGVTGNFDESFFAYLEDADIGIRAFLRGFDTIYTPDAIAHHSGFSLSNEQECDFTARFKVRNNMYIRYKNLTAMQRFKSKLYLSRGIKKLKRYYGRMGFRSNVEEGIYEAVCTKKNCKKEYKNSSFKRRMSFKNKMFKAMFSKKRGL